MAASMKNRLLVVKLQCLQGHDITRQFRQIPKNRSVSAKPRAIVYDAYGDPKSVLRLQETEIPSVGDEEVKVQMMAAPVNPADINTIQGQYPFKPVMPAIGGFEGVGRIEEVGRQVKSLKPGDLVIPNINGLGTWRNQLVCKCTEVMTFPSGTPLLFACTIRVNMCTAYRMLKDFEQLQSGDCVIQNAANSGAGQSVIQIAAARGIKTVNIVRDRPDFEDLSSYLQSLGATVVTTEAQLRQSEKALLQNLPKPKLALNAVGGKSCFTLLKHLQPTGTMVTYGGMSRQPVMVPTSSLIFSDVKVRGYWMSRWHEQNKDSEEALYMIKELCNWAKDGKVRPPKHKLHPIQDFKYAIENAMTDFQTEKQILRLD